MFSFIRFKLIVLGLFSMNIHVAKTKYVLIPIPQPYLRMSAFKPLDANGAFMAGGGLMMFRLCLWPSRLHRPTKLYGLAIGPVPYPC